MKCHNHPFFLSTSHDNVHLRLIRSLDPPYPGTLRFEVFVRRLRIRIVSRGVTWVLSTGFCGCLLVRLVPFTNPRGSTFYVCVNVSFVYNYLFVSNGT